MDPGTDQDAFRGFDCLLHAAAEKTSSMADRKRMLEDTERLAGVMLTAENGRAVPVVVYTSSVMVVGRSAAPEILFDESTPVLLPDQPGGFERPYVEGKVSAEALCEQLIRDGNMDIRRT